MNLRRHHRSLSAIGIHGLVEEMNVIGDELVAHAFQPPAGLVAIRPDRVVVNGPLIAVFERDGRIFHQLKEAQVAFAGEGSQAGFVCKASRNTGNQTPHRGKLVPGIIQLVRKTEVVDPRLNRLAEKCMVTVEAHV